MTEPSGDIEEFHPPSRGHPCASAKVLDEDICLCVVFSAHLPNQVLQLASLPVGSDLGFF